MSAHKALPTHVTIENTSACNLRCFMCEHHRADVVNKRDVMSPALFDKVLNEIKDSANLVSLTVSGDPFIDAKVDEKIEAIKRYPRLVLEVVTNGTLLDEKRFAMFSGMANPLYLSVSLDSVDPVIYRTIRQPGELGPVLANLHGYRDWAKKHKVADFHLNVSMVMMKRTIDGLVEFVEAAQSFGCDSVGLSHLTVFEERDKTESLFWFPREANAAIAKAKARAKELGITLNAPPPFAVRSEEILAYKTAPLPPCPYLDGRIYVGVNGAVEACCHSKRPIMGNVTQGSLRDIWNSPAYDQFRVALANGNPIKPCDQCYILELFKPYLYDSRAFGLDVFGERGEPPEAAEVDIFLAEVQSKPRPGHAIRAESTDFSFPSASTGDLLKSEKINAIVRCPSCSAPVILQYPDIACTSCGAHYEFENWAPVLMTKLDKLRLGRFLSNHTAETVPAINSRLRRLFFPPSPTRDPRRPKRLAKLWARFGTDKIIIDVGAQSGRLRDDIITFDMAAFAGINLVGNALRMPIADKSVDMIINTGVLEHVEDIERVVAEFHRVLRPGGVVYTEIPFMQGFHADPTDFQRLTYQGLERTFRQFVIEDMDVSSGPFSNLTWATREVVASFFSSERGFTWAWMLTGWLTAWLKYLDNWAVNKRFAHRIASSYYVVARKP